MQKIKKNITFTSCNSHHIGCDPLGAMNASKHSIDQSEDRILQINQLKNALKYS